MGLKLSWTNRGTVPLDSIRIYRSTSKTGALTLIDTIAGTATTYDDVTTPATNVTYWYSVASVKDGNETLGKRTPLGNYPDNGPGPKTIAIGDWEYGFFGEMTMDMGLLPSFDEIATAAGLTRGPESPTKFRKWAINGKIIYIPNAFIGTYSATNMINFKLLKAFNTPASPILTLDKGDHGFKVRLPTSSPTLDLSDAVPLAGAADKLKSELCAQVACALNLDTTTNNNNRYFKDGWRFGDETFTYGSSGRLFTGWQDASNVIGLQWAAYTTPAAMAVSGVLAGNIIYELDFS